MDKNLLNSKEKRKKKNDQLNNYIKYSSIGFQMMVIIAGGVWGGVKLDELANTSFPVFTLILSIVSVALGIYLAIKDFIRFK